MSQSRLRIVSAQTAPRAGQMSQTNVFPLRRRGPLPVIAVSRDWAQGWWADLVSRRCGSPERCAAMFDVTVQTARNWMAGTSRPHVDIVLQAVIWWPEAFAALAGDVQDRRAA